MDGAFLSYQLFTCKRVRLVCAAICRFSSSVGYGCWNNKRLIQEIWSSRSVKDTINQTSAAHHEMLKEPRAHNIGGMFRQNAPLIFGLFVFAVQQGRKVQVYLENKNQDRPGGKKQWIWILLPRKQRETTNYLSFFFFFFFSSGKGRNTMVTKFE